MNTQTFKGQRGAVFNTVAIAGLLFVQGCATSGATRQESHSVEAMRASDSEATGGTPGLEAGGGSVLGAGAAKTRGGETTTVPTRITFKFDPQTLTVRPEDEKGGELVVTTTSGEQRELFHNAVMPEAAVRAAEILKFYRVNEVLEVSGVGEGENFYLSSGRAPAGSIDGEDCMAFDLATLAVTEFKGTYRSEGRDVPYTQWRVADSANKPMGRINLQYSERPFAEEIMSTIRQQGLTYRCRTGDFGFWYFRR